MNNTDKWLKDKPEKRNYPIFYPILKRHENRGITRAINGRIPINKSEVKETKHALKIFFVSLKSNSSEAIKFYKKNYIIV